jgi:hypothetical protein
MSEDMMKKRLKEEPAGEVISPLATARRVIAGLAKRIEDSHKVANRPDTRPVRISKRGEVEEPLGAPPKIHRTGQ